MHNILVLGGSGLIGKAIIKEMNEADGVKVFATYFQRKVQLDSKSCFKLDIEDLESLDGILKAVAPKSIVSCLRGDFDKQLAFHTKVADYLKKNGGRLYFFSTTNVFDNDTSKPHYEYDEPGAESDYGKYKIACEKRITEILSDNACILRIPQVWGKESPRMNQLMGLLRNNEKVHVYPRLMLNTNTDVMIARQFRYIVENDLKGIFHLSAEDEICEKDFILELSAKLGYENPALEEDSEEGEYVLLQRRYSEFPVELRIDNKSVIDYLVG